MKADTYKSLLNQKSLSKDDKAFIKGAYLKQFGHEMRLKNEKCKDCYTDALLELFNSQSDIREILFNGRILKTLPK